MNQSTPPAESTMRWHSPKERENEHRLPLLLITDNAAVWRFRECFAEAGLTILDPCCIDGATLRELLERIDPLLIAVCGNAALRHPSEILAYAASRELSGACLFHVGRGLWLRGVHPQLLTRLSAASHMTHGAREELVDLIAFARFMQIVKPGLPCVDYADVAAWLGASNPESPVGFATARLHGDGSAKTGPMLRHEHDVATPRIGAICLEASMRGFDMNLFEIVALRLRASGTEAILFGACFRPGKALRCTYAIASERQTN